MGTLEKRRVNPSPTPLPGGAHGLFGEEAEVSLRGYQGTELGLSAQFRSRRPRVAKAGGRGVMGHLAEGCLGSHQLFFSVPSEETASERHSPKIQTPRKHRSMWIKSKAEVRIGLSP